MGERSQAPMAAASNLFLPALLWSSWAVIARVMAAAFWEGVSGRRRGGISVWYCPLKPHNERPTALPVAE